MRVNPITTANPEALKQSILSELYQSKDVAELIRKIKPAGIREDLRQHVFLILCEKDSGSIIEMHSSNQLKFLFVRLVMNCIYFSRTPFENLFRNKTEIPTDSAFFLKDSRHADHNEDHEREIKCKEEYDKLYWYNKELLDRYLHHGNYRAVSEETGIPLKSIYNSVQKAKKQIKEAVCR